MRETRATRETGLQRLGHDARQLGPGWAGAPARGDGGELHRSRVSTSPGAHSWSTR